MAVRNTTLDDLTAAIKNGTNYTGAGQFDGPNRSFLLQPQGQLTTADEYNNLIIGQTKAPRFSLKMSPAQPRACRTNESICASGFGGIPNLMQPSWSRCFRRAGVNAVDVAKSVRDLLPSIQSQLPSSVLLVPAYDRSQTIVSSIKDVQSTLYIAFALVVLVIFVFLGRATDTLIPAVALPLSLLLTFIAMSVLGYSLDTLSFYGAHSRHRVSGG